MSTNLLAYCRNHADEIEILTNEEYLFALSYLGTVKASSIADLALNIGFTLPEAEKLLRYFRIARLVNFHADPPSITLTEKGIQLLQEIGIPPALQVHAAHAAHPREAAYAHHEPLGPRDVAEHHHTVGMQRGVVKWFNNAKGYGFISSRGGEDVFVHHSSIRQTGFRSLIEGEEVQFEVDHGSKGLTATNVVKQRAE